MPLRQPEGAGPHVLRRMSGGHTRVAPRYADRRVLLIGDAAHVFGATGGGPGLNLGLQDAVNLGWKLAATVRGDAPVDLLASFGTERRAAAERMIVNARAQAALIAPGSDVTGLRELVSELLAEPAVVARLAHLTAGADVRYDMGPGSAHPHAGTFVPDLTVETTTGAVRLADLTHAARALLLDLTPDGNFANAMAGRHDHLDVVHAKPAGAGDEPLSALLLRPDCYLAWASSTFEPGAAEVDGLRDAAARWLGEPLTRSA